MDGVSLSMPKTFDNVLIAAAALEAGLQIPDRPIFNLQLVLVTPAVAHELLLLNTSNRDLDLRHVTRMSEDMLCGRWIATAAPVRIGWDNVIKDGQHTLHAVIKSNCPQWLVIATDLDPDVIKVIDATNKARTIRDVLSILGLDADKAVIDAIVFSIAGGCRQKALKMSNPERVEFATAVSGTLLRDFAKVSRAATAGRLQYRAIIAAVFTVMTRLEEAKRHEERRALTAWVIASLKNDALDPAWTVLSQATYNLLVNKRRKKGQRSLFVNAQAFDDSIAKSVTHACEQYLATWRQPQLSEAAE